MTTNELVPKAIIDSNGNAGIRYVRVGNVDDNARLSHVGRPPVDKLRLHKWTTQELNEIHSGGVSEYSVQGFSLDEGYFSANFIVRNMPYSVEFDADDLDDLKRQLDVAIAVEDGENNIEEKTRLIAIKNAVSDEHSYPSLDLTNQANPYTRISEDLMDVFMSWGIDPASLGQIHSLGQTIDSARPDLNEGDKKSLLLAVLVNRSNWNQPEGIEYEEESETVVWNLYKLYDGLREGGLSEDDYQALIRATRDATE